jgi:hypothetical protein
MPQPIPAEFRGRAIPKTDSDVADLAAYLQVEEAALWAVLDVEAAGKAFLPDGRPKILFERHKFSKYTDRAYDGTHPEISSRTTGGYLGGAAEYGRLMTALALDPRAALMSCSWGSPQIMGFNHELAGYGTVEEMVADFCDSEKAQLRALGCFLGQVGLLDEMRAHEWTPFAEGYNGAGQSGYDTRIAAAFSRRLAAANGTIDRTAPTARDATLAEVQALLNLAGFGPLATDGWMGPKTEAAVEAFQLSAGLVVDGVPGPLTIAKLRSYQPAVPGVKPPVGQAPETSSSMQWLADIIRAIVFFLGSIVGGGRGR